VSLFFLFSSFLLRFIFRHIQYFSPDCCRFDVIVPVFHVLAGLYIYSNQIRVAIHGPGFHHSTAASYTVCSCTSLIRVAYTLGKTWGNPSSPALKPNLGGARPKPMIGCVRWMTARHHYPLADYSTRLSVTPAIALIFTSSWLYQPLFNNTHVGPLLFVAHLCLLLPCLDHLYYCTYSRYYYCIMGCLQVLLARLKPASTHNSTGTTTLASSPAPEKNTMADQQQPISVAQTTTTLSITIQNKSNSSQVYAYITGQALDNGNKPMFIQADGKTIYYPASPSSTGAPLAVDCAIPIGAPGASKNVRSLYPNTFYPSDSV
jgi:hypothetical protein